jgi:hypothetical protein
MAEATPAAIKYGGPLWAIAFYYHIGIWADSSTVYVHHRLPVLLLLVCILRHLLTFCATGPLCPCLQILLRAIQAKSN